MNLDKLQKHAEMQIAVCMEAFVSFINDTFPYLTIPNETLPFGGAEKAKDKLIKLIIGLKTAEKEKIDDQVNFIVDMAHQLYHDTTVVYPIRSMAKITGHYRRIALLCAENELLTLDMTIFGLPQEHNYLLSVLSLFKTKFKPLAKHVDKSTAALLDFHHIAETERLFKQIVQ